MTFVLSSLLRAIGDNDRFKNQHNNFEPPWIMTGGGSTDQPIWRGWRWFRDELAHWQANATCTVKRIRKKLKKQYRKYREKDVNFRFRRWSLCLLLARYSAVCAPVKQADTFLWYSPFVLRLKKSVDILAHSRHEEFMSWYRPFDKSLFVVGQYICWTFISWYSSFDKSLFMALCW